MAKVSRSRVLLAVVGALLLAPPMTAAEGTKLSLVDVQWLQKNLQNPDLLILDASPGPMYAAQHIPGAVSVDLLLYGTKDRPLAEMERLYEAWGLKPGRQRIVLYDQGGTFLATRVLYSLYYHGFPARNLSLLDGGLAKWQASGLPVTKEPTPPPAKGVFTIKAVNEEVRVRLPEFLTASGDPAHHALVEALGPDWHFGETAPFGRPGHPPYGILTPAADFFNPDKTFKSPDELRRMMAYLSIKPDQQVYTYCGGGVAASVPFFALKFLLDYPRVKLFTESEMGWLSDERDLPYWTFDAPYLMRDTKWLQWAGGQGVRMYVGAQVSIIDLRASDTFLQGHVPFAINIPGDVFKTHVGKPDQLPALLGPAGVDPAHEAVIVSGAGLTTDAALAFVMLETLGQKRVSILVDSMERWSQLGFPTTKGPTIVAPKKGPRDVNIEPTTYAAKPRKDLLLTNAAATQGIYPKVFLASGKAMPSTAPEGKVVHVPYTQLMNADGTPKAAKDIWKILSKAGVPRYAELVCLSDDPGEAAVNYVVLRLMGYPDVKVLVN